MRDENEWIETTLEPVYRQSLSLAADGRMTLLVNETRQFHIAVLRRIVRHALREIKGDLRRIAFKHIAAVVQLILTGPLEGRLDLPDGIRVHRRGDILYFFRAPRRRRRPDTGPEADAPDKNLAFEYLIEGPGTLFVKELDRQIRFSEGALKKLPDFIRCGQTTVFFDMDKLSYPLTLRNFRPGDRFAPLGLRGTQKIKKFFINSKIPPSERAVCPLLVCGGRIVWVVGHRIADSVKIDPSTRHYLKGELLLA